MTTTTVGFAPKSIVAPQGSADEKIKEFKAKQRERFLERNEVRRETLQQKYDAGEISPFEYKVAMAMLKLSEIEPPEQELVMYSTTA